MNPENIDLDALVADREAFNSFVYTPIEDAIKELDSRWNDESIKTSLTIPSCLENGFRAVIFRQLITSNYEVRRFVSLIDVLNLKPLFWEYYADKFTSNNEWKHSLGRLLFYKGRGKKDGVQIHSLTAIDFNKSNGKSISDVETVWGQSLVDFHHELFSHQYRQLFPADFFDASGWFAENGGNADSYYKNFISLFIKHGILFENFMLDEKEFTFTRYIFLPAFIEIYKENGKKPLIVSLEPTDIEGDKFWVCHPFEDMEFIKEKLSSKTEVGASIL